MDEYLDHFLSSSSWVCTSEPAETNVLIPDPIEMMNSSNTINKFSTQDSSSTVLGRESDFFLESGLLLADASLRAVPNYGRSKGAYVGPQDNTETLTPDLQNITSSEQLQGLGESCYVRSSLSNFHTSTPIPPLWPSLCYGGASSTLNPSVLAQDKMQGFALLGEFADNGLQVADKRDSGSDRILHLDNLSAPVSVKENQELSNHLLSSFPAEPQITMSGLQPVLQNPSVAAVDGCINRSGKARVRARRGQATDPHSIAERLRREKISERMKNLQELVPNSSKSDKASMLDEIIEYVKYLQLQVKVLSMSRRGVADGAVPLIRDGQAEGPPSSGKEASSSVSSESQDDQQVVIEKELLKLMESNMTTAVQYLQSKGVCLMPIALAASIASSAHFSEETKKNSLHSRREGTKSDDRNGNISIDQEEVQ